MDLDAQSGFVMVDPNELALAVRCLVENALEATGSSGPVQIRARPVGARYIVEVADSGVGVQESQRAAVLEPFYTTKPGHVGLGLNIAQRLAERYAGSLLFRETSVGTTVALELDLAAAGG
jgi:signal transduction histidine kinase